MRELHVGQNTAYERERELHEERTQIMR
jgi:hypothetical protein